jgi:hypothetical protein
MGSTQTIDAWTSMQFFPFVECCLRPSSISKAPPPNEKNMKVYWVAFTAHQDWVFLGVYKKENVF